VTLSAVGRKGDQFKLAIQAETDVRYRTQFIATMKGTPLQSEPVLDADGRELKVTRLYSPDIGKVVAESDALEPVYHLTGKELYVRAKVISTKLHPNPYQKGDLEIAWTQPVVP
jgi:hypothetical protein